jgi:hypothetical protein
LSPTLFCSWLQGHFCISADFKVFEEATFKEAGRILTAGPPVAIMLANAV